MAKLTDKLVRNWDLQAKPLIQKEQELKAKLDKLPPSYNDDDDIFSIFNGFGDPNSRESLESKLATVQSKQLELASLFTLRVIKQAAGTDGTFNRHYVAYKDKRKAENPSWPMVYSPDEIHKDYLHRYFLLQRVVLEPDQAYILDQMFDFYKHDKNLPDPYRPEKEFEKWLKKYNI